ncbi:glycosyltransferase family 4 protein [Geminicoccus roseus]|uniref:glycosyltransferase family 4 protein n=1 Tax=Geminicoccus roseus TaxID=404900 RepID=UPI00042822A0|nr:glycosyltransferase family 4 protein [Geminicoccus roseus]
MRIAIVTNNVLPPREGIGRHVLETAQRLAARGHQVEVLAKGEAFGEVRTSKFDRVRVHHWPHRPLRPFHHQATRPLLQDLLDRLGPFDLLHAHLPLLPLLRTDARVVVTCHGTLAADTESFTERSWRAGLIRGQARLVARPMERAWFGRAERVVAVADCVREEIVQRYGVAPGKVAVVRNGVDLARFPFERRVRGGTRLLFVGRLGWRKGLFRLLDAMARLPDEVTLDLVGEGPLEADLRSHAIQLGLAHRLHFHGFLPHPEVILAHRAADLFVNPADYETGPLTLLEAMALGTPLITTATGLVREVAAGAQLRIAERTPEALADAIRSSLGSPAEMARRARDARRTVERQLGWERTVDELADLFEESHRKAA